MSTAQIIQFPSRRLPEPLSFEERELERLTNIDDIIDDIIPDLVGSLIVSGYDVTGDKHVKDIALIVESVRAAMFSYDGRYHGLHKISDKINVDAVPVMTMSANTDMGR